MPHSSGPTRRRYANEEVSSKLKCHDFPLTVPKDGSSTQRQHASQIVIAHRGASAHLPEHSLAAYRLALELGADYIEPDLVATKDKQLIAIHSLDLSITTNVEQVFGEDRKTVSSYMGNQTGYWAYDFTLEEIQQLTLKQRLPNARSMVFDGIFRIPSLNDILELLIEWNERVQPQLYNLNGNNSTKSSSSSSSLDLAFYKLDYPPPPRGVYAEIKDGPWLLQDTNMNLLDIFFQHMQGNQELWQRAMWQYMCDTKLLKQHQYKLPLLMIQAFQAPILKEFVQKWQELAHPTNDGSLSLTASVPDPDDPAATLTLPLPVPPTILLVPHDSCHREEFWFEIEDSFRDHIRGVGVDKRCFFTVEKSTQSLQYQPIIMEKARKADWVVHPWTERPETEFFVQNDLSGRRWLQQQKQQQDPDASQSTTVSSPFSTVLEEILFFKCKVGVHGIFSESVDIAVRAFNMECPNDNAGASAGSGSASGSSSGPSDACPPTGKASTTINKDNIPLAPVILFSFFLGVLSALLLWKICSSIQRSHDTNGQMNHNNVNGGSIMMTKTNTRRMGGKKHSAVPTSEDEAAQDGDLTLTPEDHEML
ncbi:glycerophosphoryl diester phosphodiesterase [Nitzschia inconspicua]|uniref:glycerophosphodiester phosphodiesterase n=1 Tax=Nitzschia inconspicua TaxID=303405 RepID=A0A9K3PHU9_9STRA|nr:glycerophosphoryl diester phosphodiesterase [Nitzschia inconspicua]